MFSPFAGLLFDPTAVRSVGDATSPPYDVIDPGERTALAARSQHNVVRLLLADDDDPSYAAAGQLLAGWRRDGTLRLDPIPRFYLYRMDYFTPDGEPRTARGILGALELVELGDTVLPHEETMAKHRADRLAVLTSTQANIDPIIALSPAPGLAGLIGEGDAPRLDFTTPDGIRHRLSDVADPERVAAIESSVAAHPVAIADGHHRYTTALGYRSSLEAAGAAGAGCRAILAFLAPAYGSGLTVAPYHRVFASFPFSPAAVADAFAVSAGEATVPHRPGDLVVVLGAGGPATALSPRPEALAQLPEPWREAGTAVARELLYPRIGVDEDQAEYVSNAAAAVAAAPAGGAAMLVSAVSESAIAAAGRMGIRFPQKSTYFVPKPRAGLVLRALGTD
ncbi:MAG TPA: DUF1015 domain-containing protein [Acidimicrobiia bacterium]|jgi:uncharacterized protein (DUF1015 family)